MGKFLVKRSEAHQEIILQLDDVQRQLWEIDQKIDGIAGKEGAVATNMELSQQ